jgi:predicted nucleic acid-binding protein
LELTAENVDKVFAMNEDEDREFFGELNLDYDDYLQFVMMQEEQEMFMAMKKREAEAKSIERTPEHVAGVDEIKQRYPWLSNGQ